MAKTILLGREGSFHLSVIRERFSQAQLTYPNSQARRASNLGIIKEIPNKASCD